MTWRQMLDAIEQLPKTTTPKVIYRMADPRMVQLDWFRRQVKQFTKKVAGR